MSERLRLLFSFWVAVVLLASLRLPSEAQTVNVTTWQNDSHRSGENSHETTLLYNTLKDTNFGQICSVRLDGQVYAQPLLLTNVSFKGSAQNQTVAYVMTENDRVYAISGASSSVSSPCTILGSISLSGSLGRFPVDCQYIGAGDFQTIAPYVGILGTPVISEGTLYVVAETQDVQSGQPNNWSHTLFAINTSNLKVISNV